MIIQTDSPAKDYDYYIVGSGPAGITLALELEKYNYKVLIIESGGYNEFNSEVTGVKGYGHLSGSYWNHHWLHVFGGTSVIWSGFISPLDERDFNNSNPLLPSWPISRNDLYPYYKQAAKVLNKPEYVIDFQQPYLNKLIYKPFSNKLPRRFSDIYPHLEKSTNIDVLLHSTVIRVGARNNRKSINVIQYHNHKTRNKHSIKINEKQQVILAAGGMGNTQLLLQSDSDTRASVGNESGLVGRFLMEHPHVYDAAEMLVSDKQKIPDATWDFGVHRDALIISNKYYNDLNMMAFTIDALLERGNDKSTQVKNSIARGHTLYHSFVRSEMLPDPANRVFLSGEVEPSGIQAIAAHCVFNANDYRNVENGIRFMSRVFMEKNAGRIKINNEEIYRKMTGGGHTMGTTRMGNHPKTSVVDKNNRVHGYANLFAVGSSVFTTSGASNPTLTIVALSLRLADYFRRNQNA